MTPSRSRVLVDYWTLIKPEANFLIAVANDGLEALEGVYDESYIAQKRKALEAADVSHERIEIHPEELSIN